MTREELANKYFPEPKIEDYDDTLVYRADRDNAIMGWSIVKTVYEQAQQETINRACEWLFSHLPILVDCYNEDIHEKTDRSEFIKLFRTQMEDEEE